MEKRCPWCGEPIPRPDISSLGEYRCRCCGKKSRVRRNSLCLWIPAGFSFLLIFITRSPYAAVSLVTVAVMLYYSSVIAPLDRKTKRNIPFKTAKAKADLIGEWSFLKQRSSFISGRIYDIRFYGKNGETVSHDIPVALGGVSFDERKMEFTVSFMPKNRLFCSFPAGTEFCLLSEDGEELCRGMLTSSVNYPRYDIEDK